MTTLLLHVLSETLLFLPLCLGIYLAYRVLKVADLTVEGSFLTAASCFTLFSQQGFSPITATVLSALVSGMCGVVVGIICEKGKIAPLFSGILAIFVLYSVNLLLLGQPNVSLLSSKLLFNSISLPKMLILMITAFIPLSLLIAIQKTKLGLLMKAYGCNKQLLADIGGHPTATLCTGLFIGNFFSGITGNLFAQASGFVDINMAQGVALTGITCVIMAKKLSKSKFLLFDLLMLFVSIYSYFFLQRILVYIGVSALYVNICLGIVLLTVMYSAKERRLA